MEYKLTIALITMNRAQQLKNAIESCVRSKLPKKTQFVIVDNGSTDNTEQTIAELKSNIQYDLVYRKESVNRGVGGGRNICFDISEGEYIYFFDDDAEIPLECAEDFFVKSIEYLDKNQNVSMLTTNIVDKIFGKRNITTAKNLSVDGLKCAHSFHGGTTFVRKSAFSSPMFLNIMYGNEEIAVSMGVLNNGCYVVYDPDIYINHLPQVDKWHDGDKDRLNMQGISNIYGIKKMLYPIVFLPILYMVYLLRIKRNGIKDKKLISEFKQKRDKFCKEQRLNKIKLKTVIKAYKQFGMTVF